MHGQQNIKISNTAVNIRDGICVVYTQLMLTENGVCSCSVVNFVA